MKKLALLLLLWTLAVVGIVAPLALHWDTVFGGTSGPPNYGNYNPQDLTGPPEEWGVEKILPSLAPGGQLHIITDPLVGDAEANGWVTFWCQSKIGFQYNIGTTGLDPLSKYSVHAFGIQAVVVDPYTPGAIDTGEGFWIQIVDSVNLNLGTFQTDANGLGGVKGVAKLPAGYSYNVGTVVSNSDNVPVLWSPSDDPNGFLVY